MAGIAKAVTAMHETKFTDEVIETIVAAIERGETLVQIAERLGSTPESVRVTLVNRGVKFDGVRGRRWVLHVSDTSAVKIADEARKRGMGSTELASLIVDTVSRDGLFSAVLDV